MCLGVGSSANAIMNDLHIRDAHTSGPYEEAKGAIGSDYIDAQSTQYHPTHLYISQRLLYRQPVNVVLQDARGRTWPILKRA